MRKSAWERTLRGRSRAGQHDPALMIIAKQVPTITKMAIATAAAVALVSSAQAVDKKAKTPEQACQAQALASIAREWPTVLHGTFEIILRGHRCLRPLQAAAVFEDKRTARLLDGKTGVLLSEFDGTKTATVAFAPIAAASSRGGRVLGESQPDVK